MLTVAFEVLVIALHVSQDSLESLSGPHDQRNLVSAASLSALISLILGIVSSAGEYGHGTVGHTFLVAPVRERVVAAKLVAAAFAGAALALVACAFAWGFAALLLSAKSVPLHLASASTLRLGLGTILAAAIAGGLGIGVGALLRRQTAAIVLALVWLLVGEPLLAVGHADRYGPGHAVASVVEAGRQGSGLLHFVPGLMLAIGYAIVAGALGIVAVSRSDVT